MFVDAIEEFAKNRPVHIPVAASEIADEAELLSVLSCPRNPDVERFLKKVQ